jgi:hypothetical protein
MLSFPLSEMMEAGPEVCIVNHEISLTAFFSKRKLLPHVFIVVKRESF